MLKLLSYSSNIYRQSRSQSPTSVDFNFEAFTQVDDLKMDFNQFFNLEFSNQDYEEVNKQTQLENIDFFSELNTKQIINDFELFFQILDALVKDNKIHFINENNKLIEYLKTIGLDEKKVKKFINIQNSRWMNLKNYIFSNGSLNQSHLFDLKKHFFCLNNKFTKDPNSNEFEDSFSVYYFLRNNRFLKKLDFIGTQTLVMYEDQGLNVSLSGESQVIRSLIKQVFPGLITRPSNSFFNNLKSIFYKLISEIDNFENISPERLSSIREFLISSKSIIDKDIQKDVFKENFISKFDSYKLESFGLRPQTHVFSMSKEDIASYLNFNSLKLKTKIDFKEGLIKVFQALLVGKMWCAEKAIMHNLAKEGKYIDLDKVKAFVLNKYIDPSSNLKKSRIKVCNHCVLMASFLNSCKKVGPSTPKRVKHYEVSPKTSPSTHLERCLTENKTLSSLGEISRNLMLDFNQIPENEFNYI